MSAVAWTLSTLLVLYLLFVEPLWGAREYRGLKERRSIDPGALLRLYHLTVAVEWAWVAWLGLVVLAGGVAVDRLVTPPEGLVVPEAISSIGPGLVVGLAVALVVGAVVARRAKPGQEPPSVSQFAALLPVTRRERRWFAAVAVTAGTCEELVFRGFATFYLASLFPDLQVIMLVVLAAVMFGTAHAYQGPAGVAATFALGLAFGTIYLATGSLVPGMVLHALIDLRALLLARPADQHLTERPAG